MEELQRLRVRKRRRQACLEAISQVEDRLKQLERVSLWRLIFDRKTTAKTLAEIAARCGAVRAEFLVLAASDEKERQSLEVLLKRSQPNPMR